MVRIVHHQTVVRDGMHNMGPHIIHWRNLYLIGHRKAEWHHESPNGTIHILASTDRRRWQDVAQLKMPGDNRDSEFIIAPDGRLAVTWVSQPRAADNSLPWQTIAHIAFTDDGRNWSEPQRIMRPEDHLFCVRQHEGTYYGLNCWRQRDEATGLRRRRLELYVSEDLLEWRKVSQIGEDALGGNEAGIWFDDQQRAHIIARTEGDPPGPAVYAVADPPYTDWQIQKLPMVLHCPRVLPTEHGVLLSARHFPGRDGDVTWPFGASLGLWRVDVANGECRLEPLLRLPATGDSSYSSMVREPGGRVLLTYYSQHAYHWGVLPPFQGKLAENPVRFGERDVTPAADDIYLAELEVA